MDKLIAYEVVSLAPQDAFKDGVSWRLKFSLERGYENNCTGLCRWTELSGGSGVTKTFWSHLDASFWMRITGQTSPDFVADTWTLGAGPGASLRWNKDDLAILAETYFRYDYKGKNHEFRQHKVGVNWSLNKSLSLRLNAEETNTIQNLEALVLYYY